MPGLDAPVAEARRPMSRGVRPRCRAHDGPRHGRGSCRPLSALRPDPGARPLVPLDDGELDRHALHPLPTGACAGRCLQFARVPSSTPPTGGAARPLGHPRPRSAEDFLSFFGRRQSILTLNPLDHTRLRGLSWPVAFTPSTVEALRPHVVVLCDGLLDTVAELAAGGRQLWTSCRRSPSPSPWPSSASCSASRSRTGPNPNPSSGPPPASSSPSRPSTTPGARQAARVSMEQYWRPADRRSGDGQPADQTCCRSSSPSPTATDRLTQDEVVSTRHPALRMPASRPPRTSSATGCGRCWASPDQLASATAPGGRRRLGTTSRRRAVLRWDSPGAARRTNGVSPHRDRGPTHRFRRARDDPVGSEANRVIHCRFPGARGPRSRLATKGRP